MKKLPAYKEAGAKCTDIMIILERAWFMKVMEQKNLYTLQNMEEFIISRRNVYIFTRIFKVFYIKMYIKKEMLPVENMVSVKVVAVMWN